MDRAEKAQTIEALKAEFTGHTLVVVAHYTGLTVSGYGPCQSGWAVSWADRDRAVTRSRRGGQGCDRLCQGQREIRRPGRVARWTAARRRWRQGTGYSAVDRRAARQAPGAHRRSGDADRRYPSGSRWAARAGYQRACQQGPGSRLIVFSINRPSGLTALRTLPSGGHQRPRALRSYYNG
jgi:hypothetical protein